VPLQLVSEQKNVLTTLHRRIQILDQAREASQERQQVEEAVGQVATRLAEDQEAHAR
jgi:hypothetical protein